MLAANYVVPNSDVKSSLGRDLSGNAPNVTVNLVAPGTMYGDRINELDFRAGKILKFGRSRTVLALDIYNALNSSAVLTYNNAFVPGEPGCNGDDSDPGSSDSPQNSSSTTHPKGEIVSSLVLATVDRGGSSARGRSMSRGRRGQKKCVLYSTRRDAQISSGDREMPRILDQGLTEGLDFYSEYIDQARFIDPGYETAFRDFLRLKYGGQRFDLVIAIQNTAIQLFDTYGPELFPDTPMVFFTDSGAVRRIPTRRGGHRVDLRGFIGPRRHCSRTSGRFSSSAGRPQD